MPSKPGTKSIQVRMPPELYERLKDIAGKKQWSVNHYIIYRLQEDTKPR